MWFSLVLPLRMDRLHAIFDALSPVKQRVAEAKEWIIAHRSQMADIVGVFRQVRPVVRPWVIWRSARALTPGSSASRCPVAPRSPVSCKSLVLPLYSRPHVAPPSAW